MAESELIASYQMPNGEKVQKFRASDGEESYRRSDGTFVSPDVGKGIENQAARDVGDSQQVEFIVAPQRTEDRESAIRERYPEVDNYEGLNPNNPKPQDSEIQRLVKGWMGNDTLNRQIKQDPLLQTQQQEEEALEARARQIAQDLQKVENEREAIQILRQYGVES